MQFHLPVEFSRLRKNDRSCRHVDANTEGFGGEKAFDETFLEKDLYHFLQNGELYSRGG
jgi:hypothetical protein